MTPPVSKPRIEHLVLYPVILFGGVISDMEGKTRTNLLEFQSVLAKSRTKIVERGPAPLTSLLEAYPFNESRAQSQ